MKNVSPELPESRKDELIIQKLSNKLLIYDLKINKAYCLIETFALVCQECDGSKFAGEISSHA